MTSLLLLSYVSDMNSHAESDDRGPTAAVRSPYGEGQYVWETMGQCGTVARVSQDTLATLSAEYIVPMPSVNR